jgi:two-component system alkaline phosphatase synthesis response regulator PhoP
MLKKRILVVDDDKEIVRLMSSYLEAAGYDVLAAYNGEAALHTIRREHPDLVLLDLMLPERDGLEITRLLRSDPFLAQTPVIMITARVSDTDKIVGLEMGADDYITKPYNPREVLARVRACLRVRSSLGEGFQDKVLRTGGLELDTGLHRVTVDGRAVDLTATEFDILQALLERAGFVLERSELVRRALGSEFLGVERTLDSHIRNLRHKIEPDPKKPRYIQTVYGIGYRLEG